MRTMGKLWMVAALVVLVAASAGAITSGPGGRMYSAAPVKSGDGSGYLRLWSLVLDENWDVVGGVNAWTNHGDIVDNNISDDHRRIGCSPEIETYGGDGYGTIVIGANYNNNPPTQSTTYPTCQTMDYVEITPGDAGHTANVLGDGKTIAGSKYGAAGTGCLTDRCYYGVPDPVGGFTGGPGYYTTANYIHHNSVWINTDVE